MSANRMSAFIVTAAMEALLDRDTTPEPPPPREDTGKPKIEWSDLNQMRDICGSAFTVHSVALCAYTLCILTMFVLMLRTWAVSCSHSRADHRCPAMERWRVASFAILSRRWCGRITAQPLSPPLTAGVSRKPVRNHGPVIIKTALRIIPGNI